MTKALGVAGEGPVDSWLVKGGKSLRVILQEVQDLQTELNASHGISFSS
jgi:hypothetical protein